MNFKNHFEELKRRNVFKAALAYLVVSWVIVQVASIVFPAFKATPGALRTLILVLVIGFPVWLIFAWVYEVTPDGLKKTKAVARNESITGETSKKFNQIILGALIVAIVLLAVNVYGTYTRNGPEVSDTKPDKSENIPAIDSESDQEKSVAVLAFADMSPEKDQEYFSDGISEEILNYLAKNPELSVISRTSSFSFKGKDTDIREIGKKLNANYVLEGSVRKADSTLRITAQLIHVDDGAHLWSETYDRKMDDIFSIQDEIAEAVTKNLEASLLGKEIAEVDTEAYNKYLQAKHLWNQYTQESLENADKLINESIEIDDNYAPAWLMLAIIKDSRRNMNFINRESAAKDIDKAIDKAISLDPEYAEAYAFAGRIALRNINYTKAEINFKKALELAPRNPDVLILVSQLPTLDIKVRIRIVKKAIELDPLEYINYYRLSYLYFLDEQYEKALKTQEKYMLYYPNSMGDYAGKAEILAQLGKEREALEALEKEKDEFLKAYGNAMVTMILYAGEKTDQTIETFKTKYGQQDPYMVAQMYAWQNKKDKAFEWLGKAYKVESVNLVQIMDDPYMKNLKNDRRWEEFVEKIGFPQKSNLEINLD
ncbi:hypothetical protein NE848_07075 [Gramella jeungdoensis]|uniref:Tetratricopeptide repeat protein n=1 Tax=Gramella jeungdoensis TaxID=708091 RepID=A0ABT0Z087_9FLAO|nr:hypothetical protein [Gramella jeungdoensis]MCM8569133.1 hypothetical protein [Gramella jeungdoensis]